MTTSSSRVTFDNLPANDSDIFVSVGAWNVFRVQPPAESEISKFIWTSRCIWAVNKLFDLKIAKAATTLLVMCVGTVLQV